MNCLTLIRRQNAVLSTKRTWHPIRIVLPLGSLWRYVAQPKHPGGGCWASRAHSTPIRKDIWPRRGTCVYTNNWCTNTVTMDTDSLSAIYIRPDANTTTALDHLLTAISKQQRDHPDGVYVIAGDFNKANSKTVLPRFYQHLHCPTSGENTLDHVYSNIKYGFKSSPSLLLGQSDHIPLFLTPAYRPCISRDNPLPDSYKYGQRRLLAAAGLFRWHWLGYIWGW